MSSKGRKFFWLFLVLAAVVPTVASAQGFLQGLDCVDSGKCSLEEVGLAFVLLSKWLLGLMGAFALFYFVWGGIWWLTSAGNQDKVKRGRDIMVGTTIALFVAFGSYLLLDLWVNNILGSKTGQFGAECVDRSAGARCGDDNFHVCAGNNNQGQFEQFNGLCVTRCEYYNIANGIASISDPNDPAFGSEYVCADVCSSLLLCDSNGQPRQNVTSQLESMEYLPGHCPAVKDYCVPRIYTNF